MLDVRPHEVPGGDMLFVFDLDGTLLNSKKEISESNKNAVQKLSNDIYCFGDDYNDIGMFKFCKNTVAMGNAISERKIPSPYSSTIPSIRIGAVRREMF